MTAQIWKKSRSSNLIFQQILMTKILFNMLKNIIQRALSLKDDLWLCFIVDGVHVDLPALGNYLRAAGIERSIAVTDAISAARLGPGTYTLAGWTLEIGEDLIARAPGGEHFVGSTVTIPKLLNILANDLRLTAEEIDLLTVKNPRAALGANL